MEIAQSWQIWQFEYTMLHILLLQLDVKRMPTHHESQPIERDSYRREWIYAAKTGLCEM